MVTLPYVETHLSLNPALDVHLFFSFVYRLSTLLTVEYTLCSRFYGYLSFSFRDCINFVNFVNFVNLGDDYIASQRTVFNL